MFDDELFFSFSVFMRIPKPEKQVNQWFLMAGNPKPKKCLNRLKYDSNNEGNTRGFNCFEVCKREIVSWWYGVVESCGWCGGIKIWDRHRPPNNFFSCSWHKWKRFKERKDLHEQRKNWIFGLMFEKYGFVSNRDLKFTVKRKWGWLGGGVVKIESWILSVQGEVFRWSIRAQIKNWIIDSKRSWCWFFFQMRWYWSEKKSGRAEKQNIKGWKIENRGDGFKKAMVKIWYKIFEKKIRNID